MKNTCEIWNVLRAFLHNNILRKFSLFCFLLAFTSHRNVPLPLQPSQGAVLRVPGVIIIPIFNFKVFIILPIVVAVRNCSCVPWENIGFNEIVIFIIRMIKSTNMKITMMEQFSFPISKQNKTHFEMVIQSMLFS